jgi:hypothetical protein
MNLASAMPGPGGRCIKIAIFMPDIFYLPEKIDTDIANLILVRETFAYLRDMRSPGLI